MSRRSTDTRNVTTDALATLGTIIGPGEKRDAIHIAVEPVIAGETLGPGVHVTVKDGVATETEDGEGVGIVDPFLTTGVRKGQRFWLLVYPRQVQSLRHVWSHPAFADEEATQGPEVSSVAGEWLKEYATGIDLQLQELLNAAKRWLRHGDYLVDGGKFESLRLDPAFWEHYEAYTGEKVPESRRENFFSCSC